MKQRIFSTFLFLLLATASYAQKKPLDHSVYDGWKSLSNIRISKDGKILTALISRRKVIQPYGLKTYQRIERSRSSGSKRMSSRLTEYLR